MRIERDAGAVASDQAVATQRAPVHHNCVVLKFGSSVLGEVDDLRAVVTEIYRHARQGTRVVAVVSAFLGETDRLIEEASRFGAAPGSNHAPGLIALGEKRAAALLAIACDQAGLDACVMGARALDLRAGGAIEDAEPQAIDKAALTRALAVHDVVVVPGFIAIGAKGEAVLLGRGGSDLTAAFIAGVLGLGEVTLLKDVEGVYDRDPAIAVVGPPARLYRAISWAEARLVAGKLVQSKAIAFAEARGVGIRVARIGGDGGSVIGTVTDEPEAAPVRPPLRVGLAGLGVVGGGTAIRLAGASDFQTVAALARDERRARLAPGAPGRIVPTTEELLASGADIIVDALSCGETGARLTREALRQGVDVVSANKMALAGRLADLTAVAAQSGATLRYSAAVGGGAPMLETIARAAAEGRVERIEAVLNGTVNFILGRLRDGAEFDAAVRLAQSAGFAEADPAADLTGADAAAKASLLAFAAFGAEPAPGAVRTESLDAVRAARIIRAGGVWRQVTRVRLGEPGHPVVCIAFEPVDHDPLLGACHDERNALRATLHDGRTFVCRGRGAGRTPTVEALLADLYDLRGAS